MFRVLLLSALVALPMWSCSKEEIIEEPQEEKEEVVVNPLAKTLWVMEDNYWGYTRYIEFGEIDQVAIWDTHYRERFSGTYSIEGNKVIFTNLYDKCLERRYIDGTFTSISLTLNCYNTLKGEYVSYTYIKQ